MTVSAAIRELEKIELVRRNNGRYRLNHAVSKRQKIILSSFGLNADDIKSLTTDIDMLITNNQSLMDTEADPDGEEL